MNISIRDDFVIFIIFLIIAWLSCLCGIYITWLWLKTYNKYKPISPEDTLRVTTRQKRLIKISLIFSCITVSFLLAHFIIKSTEDYIEEELQDETDEIVKLLENITQTNATSETDIPSNSGDIGDIADIADIADIEGMNYTEAKNVSEI